MPAGPSGPPEFEWLDLGPPDRHDADRPERGPRHTSRRPRARTIVAIGAVVAAAAVIVVVATAGHHPHHRPPAALPSAVTTTGPAAAPTTDRLVFTATAAPRSGPPRVTVIGHPLLGVTDAWDLFVRGDAVLARVQLAAGRVTLTPAPLLGSGGGVSLLLTHSAAYVVPYDFVPGYAVPDGAAADLLTGGLASGGFVYPGPSDGQFWQQSQSTDNTSAYELVDRTGRDLHRTITLPPSMTGAVMSDGRGYLIAHGIGGDYDAQPGRLHRITTGAVTAVGPSTWLAEECDDAGSCTSVVIDSATGDRRVIGPTTAPSSLATGVVSPDGTLAAVARPSANRRFAVNLIQLNTGAERTVLDIPDAVFNDQTMAWSPDGRYLFVIGAGGSIQVIDSRSLQHVDLGVQLPAAVQLAIRPAA